AQAVLARAPARARRRSSAWGAREHQQKCPPEQVQGAPRLRGRPGMSRRASRGLLRPAAAAPSDAGAELEAPSTDSEPSSPAPKRADSARAGRSSGSPPPRAASAGSGESGATGPASSSTRASSSNSRSQRRWKMHHQQQRSTSSSSAEDLESRVEATGDRQP
ncbi:unnamed protein product, partial [Prorocentrum cordatum]